MTCDDNSLQKIAAFGSFLFHVEGSIHNTIRTSVAKIRTRALCSQNRSTDNVWSGDETSFKDVYHG